MTKRRFFPTVFFLLITQFIFSQNLLIAGFTIEKELAKGQFHQYEMNLEKGQLATIHLQQKGADVRILLLNTKEDTLQVFDSPNGSEGMEEIEFAPTETGKYVFLVEPLTPESEGITDPVQQEEYREENQGAYAIEKVNILSAKEYADQLAAEEAALQKVVTWFDENSVELKTAQAENGFDDLQFLKSILKDVKIVGLGEATHGTKEFFQMKHRMLEFLIEEMDFSAFVIEASYSACLNINDYVLHGKGNKEDALSSQGFWTWDTEEVLDLIEWMRQYNLNKSEDEKIKFYGNDVQSLGHPTERLEPIFSKIDTALRVQFDSLRAVQNRTVNLDISENKNTYDSVTNEGYKLLAHLMMNEGAIIKRTSKNLFNSAIDNYRVFLHAWETNNNYLLRQKGAGSQIEIRDLYMAENTLYLMSQLPPDTKMVLWAHNGHVSSKPDGFINGGIKPMGAHLKEHYGNAYYSIGFAFNKGGFQAYTFSGENRGLKGFKVGAAEKPNTDWVLAQANKPISFTNLKKELPDYMQDYLKNKVSFFGTGAGFGDDWNRTSYSMVDFDKTHEAIIFFDTTTRAVPSKNIKERMTAVD